MNQGYLCLVLHAHLPYVRHLDREDYLEEKWLYEALVESYIPLLMGWERLVAENVDYRVTLSLSPTLLTMLADPLVHERTRKYLASRLELALKEGKRTAQHPKEYRLAKMYQERFREIASYCNKYQYNLIPAFARLRDTGRLELITSTATHAFLPFIETEEAIRAQILNGIETFDQVFGYKPQGIWLPECGYSPGVDRLLRQAGIRYFFVDHHGIEHATPKPRRGIHAPLLTEYGVAAFARDPESSEQVWSSYIGYPGDYDYREYYRDIGFDLDLDYIAPYIHPSGIRVNTGLKYHRVTGNNGEPKAYYHPGRATEKAASHAGHFLWQREQQVLKLCEKLDREPIIVAPYDAELFGHWWYEGPQFLEFLMKKIAYDSDVIHMITPTEYLDKYQENDCGRLPMCSWGRNGYGEVWLNQTNDWMYRHLHQAEKRMVEMVTTTTKPTELEQRMLQQAARELMLAQSSDWAFIMDNKSMVEYAIRRFHDHLSHFTQLYENWKQGHIDEQKLSVWEKQFPIFSGNNPAYYIPRHAHTLNVAQNHVAAGIALFPADPFDTPKLRIFMLSWEFPPHSVGGLSKAVYDLSRYLALQHVEVHLLTSYVEGAEEHEVVEGVYVYRLRTHQPPWQTEFLDWVFQLNLAMIDKMEQLLEQGLEVDLIHAHDWLVAFAAEEAKERFSLPILTTIHAMEHGRNQGIHTPLQANIHRIEHRLVDHSDRVIACSQYMASELSRHFDVPFDKITVVPNGIEVPQGLKQPEELSNIRLQIALPEERIVFFVGRMVREKGVQLLLEAAPRILSEHPEAKFVLAGKGPMLEELQLIAQELGLCDKVLFLGFIEDELRNAIFQLADVAVFPSLYEPFGLVALEASSFRTPLLVADTGGLSEIVTHGLNGLKVYPGDVASLETQLIWLLDHPEQGKGMALEAYQSMQATYNWTQIAKETIDLYHLLLPEREVLST
ncbi:1,4-alpha-glucan branching protein domain-containing protein [Brevibacillus ginsengisoli]|uniref:1,4-alpha-glucan branching protein domain-containing protein n=1 Tax=Brevibacillus ginsengisoli TaxID=363854 RepID=UPI003CE8B0BA